MERLLEIQGIDRGRPEVFVEPACRNQRLFRALEVAYRFAARAKGVSGEIGVSTRGRAIPPRVATAVEGAQRTTMRVKVGEGLSFEEAVKGLRERWGSGIANLRILGVPTKDGGGNLIVRFDEAKHGAGTDFARLLRKRANLDTDVRVVQNEQTVALRGFDPLVAPAVAERALRSLLQIPDAAKVKVDEPRLVRAEVWRALVTLPAEPAGALLRHRTVQIGNRRCRPEVWGDVSVCYRCHVPGHRAKDCKIAGGAGKLCYGCGGSELIARDCTGTPRCYTCNIEGHRADSSDCPARRKRTQEVIGQGKRGRRGDLGSTEEWITVGHRQGRK